MAIFFAESQSLVRYLPKYNACSIKLETKVMFLHRIGFVNKYVVHDF